MSHNLCAWVSLSQLNFESIDFFLQNNAVSSIFEAKNTIYVRIKTFYRVKTKHLSNRHVTGRLQIRANYKYPPPHLKMGEHANRVKDKMEEKYRRLWKSYNITSNSKYQLERLITS